MDRLARDALAAVSALLERHGGRPLEAWTPGPPGCSPVELAVAGLPGTHDVRWQHEQLRWTWTWGIRTHWTPPESVRHFVADWDAGRYPDLVTAGPF